LGLYFQKILRNRFGLSIFLPKSAAAKKEGHP